MFPVLNLSLSYKFSFRLVLLFFALTYSFLWNNSNAVSNKNPISQNKIAILDIQFLLEHSLAVQSINNQLMNIDKIVREEIIKSETECKEIEQYISSKKSILSNTDLQQQIDKLNKAVQDLKISKQKKRGALEKAHKQALAEVNNAVFNIIEELSKQKAFVVAIPSNQVLFALNELNITKEVLEILNKKLTTIDVPYAAFYNQTGLR